MNEAVKVVIKELQALECPICKTKVRIELLGGDKFNTLTCGHKEIEELIQDVINPPVR